MREICTSGSVGAPGEQSPGATQRLPERGAGVRRRHFGIARNSLGELVAALDLAAALGAVDAATTEQALTLAGRVRPMLYGLMRPRR